MSHNTLSQSSMEFLKNCTTGVDLVPGFASVHYWVYTVESLSDASKLVEDRSLEDALFEAEIVVRDRRHIVYHDVPRKALWFFAGATGASDALFMHPPELDNGSTGIERHGWVFKIIFSGMFKASELSIYSSRLAATFSPVPSGQSPTPAGMLSAAANARGFQHNTASSGGAPANSAIGFPYDRNDIRSIHSFFIQGVQACFAYTLAKGGKALQLDARTFVTAPEPDDDLSSNRESQSLSVFTIDHSLANGGGMLVSTSIRNDTRLSSYVECVVDMEDHAEIVIAPGGLFASVIHGHRTAEDNDIRKWKAYVRDSLRGRGIDLAMLDPQNRWLLLKLRDQSDVNDIYATSSTVFYWPMVLCFSCQSFVVPTDDPHEDEPTDLYWVRPTDADGYTEPLRFAQEWYNGKTNRDNVVEERGRILDLAKKQAENAILTVTTPAYTRDGLQATAGVYPTPPDGVLSQVSHAQTLDVPAVSLPVDQAAYRSGLDMQHSDMMDLDMGPFEDNVRQGPSVISRGSLDAVMKMDGDDLFGDLEDEDLRGQDITDADFSFFDEPEIPDEEMMDNIIEDPGDGSITKMEDDKPTADRTGSKELTVNVQGLLNATATEQNKNNSSILATKTRHAQTLDLIEKVKDTPMNNTDHSLQSERDHNEPLSPSSIRRKLFDFTIRPAMTGRRASQFQPLPFNALLQQHDAKYILDGSFGFKVMYPQSAGRHFATSPYIKPRPPDVQGRRRSIQPRKSITFPGQTGLYDGDSSSDASISSDDESVYGNGAPSFVTSPVKGKFPTGNESTGDDAQSVPGTNLLIGEDFNLDVNQQAQFLETILCATGQQAVLTRTLSRSPRAIFHPERATTLKCRPLASVVNNDGPLNPFHKDFINVAQIVAEQLAAGFINGSNKAVDISGSSILSNGVQTDPNATDLKTIMAAVRSCFTTMSHCDLLRWLCVQEAAPEKPNIPKGHPPVPQKKALIPGLQTSDGIQVPMTTLTPLGPPHVRVRRNEGLWDVLPPALPFWEQLGLAPAVGRKNVMAFCVYPGSEDLRSQIGIFMDYLGAAFESCKLGAHVRATQIGAFKDGMVPVQLSAEHTLQTAVRAVREACVELGKTLASINWHSKIDFNPAIEDFTKIDNFVIYMINPFGDNHRGLMELCASFWTLYETYRAAVASPSHKVSRPDVVLQVLPIRYIAGLRAPIIMDSAFFQKLTREVYDRCPPAIPDTTASRLPIESGAAVQLEQPLPRKIDFKLQADPPPDLLHEGSNLHLGYAKSNNGEWVSVAWTDGTGKYQASASYCLVGRRTFIDVARVIWQSTLEIMQARRVAWRLCIARAGFLDKEELDAWSMLATSASSLVMITVITSVDPDPPVSVFHDQPTMSSRPGANVAPQTPVGTPRSGVSPDTVLTPAATPNAETGPDVSNDPDAHLVDIGDETWGLILGHRTNVSSSIADYRPSLSAGYLMKSNTTLATALDDHDEADIRRIVLVGVKLVWIGSSPKPAPAPQQQSQPSPMSFQSSFSALSSSPTDIGAGTGLSIPPTPPETSAPGQQPPGQLNTSTSGSSIPKVTADSILRDYLQMYRNLGVLARARGLRGTKRGALPWHVVVALRAVEGLETSYGTMQANS